MLEEGNVLEAINTGQLNPPTSTSPPSLVWQRARLVAAGANDGTILQVKLGNTALVGSSNVYRLALTNSVNNPGWILSSGSLSDDSNPTIYTGINLGSAYSVFNNTGYVEIPLDYAPFYDKRREVGKITAVPHRFESARVQVFGENIFCQKDPNTSFGGSLGSVDGMIYVQSSQFGSYLSLGMDPSNGNVKLSNNNGNATPFDTIIESEGNIILDNQSTQSSGASNKGIVLQSNDGVFIDCKSSSGNGNVTFRVGQSSNQAVISLTTSGLDMGGKDISDVDTTYTNALSTNGIDFNPRTNNANMPVGSMTGFLTGERVSMECPLRLWGNSNAAAALAGSTYADGTMAYRTTTDKVLVKANGTVKTVVFEEDYSFPWESHGWVALGLRQRARLSGSNPALRDITATKSCAYHYAAHGATNFDQSSATHGSKIMGLHHTINVDVLIDRVLLRSFGVRTDIKNETGISNLNISFEVWIGPSPIAYWEVWAVNHSTTLTLPTDIINNNTSSTSTCQKIHTYTDTLNSNTNNKRFYNPFTTNGAVSTSDLDITLSTPFAVQAGTYVTIYCVERCNIPSSNSNRVEIINYTNQESGWGNAAVPLKYEFFGKQKG